MRRFVALMLLFVAGCQPGQPTIEGVGEEGGGPSVAPTGALGTIGPGARAVTAERLLNADQEPHNWLMYSGGYKSQRYSTLDQINRSNVESVKVEWVFQFNTLSNVETTPIVVDGLMFITESPSNLIALDAATGRPFWRYDHPVNEEEIRLCCGLNNRGVAVLGDLVYLGTADAHLLALDIATGNVIWDVEVARADAGYSITSAPLVIGDKVLTGMAGGEFGVRGFLDAYDAKTGELAWRFYTIPGPGEPGNDTWSGDSWRTGGAPTWITGSYDPELNLVYWGTGNPAPDWNGDMRLGDNLYADAVVALDADTGELVWHFQFTPHDTHDWDAIQVPVLADLEVGGVERKLMLWANRNAFYYVLDRATGEFLHGVPFAEQTWAQGLDPNGRPILVEDMDPTEEGVEVAPTIGGATNWNSPSYSPQSGLFYTYALDGADIYYKRDDEYVEGDQFTGGYGQRADDTENFPTAIRALDPLTGALQWEYPIDPSPGRPGILTTAGGLLFSGSGDGYIYALDQATGESLWYLSVGRRVHAAPMTYSVGGRQYVSVAASHALFTFALP
jgi:alcohol dehydrogenase (cytochrome c)